MRNITQQEIDAILTISTPVPEKVMFAVGTFGGKQELYHKVTSSNAHYFLQEDQFLAESADGKEVSVIHINNIRVPMKKPQVEQKKRKKYKRPCNGVDYLEKIPFEYSKVKVGDKVQLRNGSVQIISRTEQRGSLHPIVAGAETYTRNGEVWEGEFHKGDILYILRKTKKSVPKTEQKKDEFRFVNSSTGQEIVFSRDELQLIKEIIGKVAEADGDFDYSNAPKADKILCKVFEKLELAGFWDCNIFTNDVILRPDTPTLIYKE